MREEIWSKVKVGDEYSCEFKDVNRSNFVRYAGAGGDFNPIHHDQTFAEKAGLPTVFGMGMFTAGVLGRVPSEWFGPTSIRRYAIKFTSRIWADDTVLCHGRVTKVYEENGVRHADLELRATNQKQEDLIRAEATVRDWTP